MLLIQRRLHVPPYSKPALQSLARAADLDRHVQIIARAVDRSHRRSIKGDFWVVVSCQRNKLLRRRTPVSNVMAGDVQLEDEVCVINVFQKAGVNDHHILPKPTLFSQKGG